MQEPDLELAKNRIWARMSPKLLDRGVHSEILPLLRSMREPVRLSRLKKVQAKERLLDLIPERSPTFHFSLNPGRWWSLGTLGVLMSVMFAPLMDFTPEASAFSHNRLEVVEGEVYINGVLVQGESLVQEGDTVTTAEGSMAHLSFLDDSRITLGPSTTVDIVDTWVDPTNKANTRIVVNQTSGRVWTQVLNLLSESSSFVLSFPQGQVSATQRASFDLQVNGEESTLEVVRSLVDVEVSSAMESYAGILGQDAVLMVSDQIETSTVDEAEKNDVWWTFNLAYGKSYARSLDEHYKNETISVAMILPGNPLYGLKTFREDLQVSLAFTVEAKQDLLIQQAEARLDEAQVLLARGETDKATEVLKDYQATVIAVTESGVEDSSELLAHYDETQKQAFVNPGSTEAEILLQEHLTDTSKLLFSDLLEQIKLLSQTASQPLQQIPDLIAENKYAEAVLILEAYQKTSLSILSALETVEMDQREALVSALLEQKTADVQLLRVIATLPDLKDDLNVSATVLEQMSVLALSLREKELGELTSFFETTDYEESVQQDLYERIKEEAPMTEALADQFTILEEEMGLATDLVVIDLTVVDSIEIAPELDPSIPHTDQTQDQTESGE